MITATILFIVLAQSDLTPPPFPPSGSAPAVSAGGVPRSTTLIREEMRVLETQLARIERTRPVWLPLVLGGGAAVFLGSVGTYFVVNGLNGGGGLSYLILGITGGLAAIVVLSIGIAVAVSFGNQNASKEERASGPRRRLQVLQEELNHVPHAALAPWRVGLATVSNMAPVLTF